MSDHLCTELELPYDKITQLSAYQIAKAANMRNIPEMNIIKPMSLALQRNKIHKVGSTLKIAYVNGSSRQKNKVENMALDWTKYANIKLEFLENTSTNVTKSDVRVAFKWQNDGGSWSYVGTDIFNINQKYPTMNFGWLNDNTDDLEYSRVVKHEFGHTLGCTHEHQSPGAGSIPWNKQAVYDYYARQGWSKADVDHNIFKRYSESETQFSQFDTKSIMLYPIPNSLTIGNYSVGLNTDLSVTDKEFIGIIYPIAQKPTEPQFPLLTIDGPAINASIGKWMEEDYYQFGLNADTPQKITIQTQGKLDTVMSLMDSTKTVIAWDDDTGQERNSLISKVLNKGQYIVRVRHYNIFGTGDYSIEAMASQA